MSKIKTEGEKHIEKIDALISDTRYRKLDPYKTELLADEIIRLRRVIANLTPFMVHAAEEAVEFAEELENSGVDPTEPALKGLKETIDRLRVAFKG